MKEPKKKPITIPYIITICIALLFLFVLFATRPETKPTPVTEDVFKQKMNQKETTADIGTNITLHQEIHGENGITYRYKLKTDCPYWQYEDRYVSEKPLDWISKNAAVETKAYAFNLTYDGVSYAQGQFFEVPLLNLTQDDKTKEEYVAELTRSAYQEYLADIQIISEKEENKEVIGVVIILLCVFSIFGLVLEVTCPVTRKHTDKSKTDDKASDTIDGETPHRQKEDVN